MYRAKYIETTSICVNILLNWKVKVCVGWGWGGNYIRVDVFKFVFFKQKVKNVFKW